MRQRLLPFLLLISIVKEQYLTDKKTHFLISDAHIRTADGIKAIKKAGNARLKTGFCF